LPPKERLKPEDNWIISRLIITVINVRSALDKYRFNEASHILYDFIWKDFCDWYIEAKKDDFYRPEPYIPNGKPFTVERDEIRENAFNCASYTLSVILKLLHPFMPFVTEEIWQHLREKVQNSEINGNSIMLEKFPIFDDNDLRILPQEEGGFLDFLREIITGLRTIRSENNVPPEKKVSVVIIPFDDLKENFLKSCDHLIKYFVKTDNLIISRKAQKPSFAGQNVINKTEIYVILDGLVDLEAEKEKIAKEITRLENAAKGFEARLNNEEFTQKAPPKVIEAEKAKYANVLETLEKLRANLG